MQAASGGPVWTCISRACRRPGLHAGRGTRREQVRARDDGPGHAICRGGGPARGGVRRPRDLRFNGMTTLDQAVLTLPFRGTWRAEMSPARRVPSHGTHLFATTYGIDFVAVQGRRSATTRDWRTVLSTERPDRFFAFGQPFLAPVSGRVVLVIEGEADYGALR